MTNMIHISRREFALGALNLSALGALSSVPFPLSAAEQSIIWTGVSFIQDCSNDCGDIEKFFPRLAPQFRKPENGMFLYNEFPGEWGSMIGKAQQRKLVWLNDDHAQSSDVFKTELAIMLGITSERHYATFTDNDVTYMVYEVQSYIFVIDVDALQNSLKIVNCVPIRLMKIDGPPKGKYSNEELDQILRTKMWETIRGDVDQKIQFPKLVEKAFSKINFSNLKSPNIRVTGVTYSSLTKKTLKNIKPNPSTDQKFSPVDLDNFGYLLGNTATTAISEKFNIGIQPYTPNAALGLLIEDVSLARGEDTSNEQKLLMNGPIDLDIRIHSKGIIVKEEKKDGYQSVVNKKIIIALQLNAGKYERTYDSSGQIEQNAVLIGEPIFKQNLVGLTMKLTTKKFDSDWYDIIDMHQRLLDWFFTALSQNKDLSQLTKGQRSRHKRKEFLQRVSTKDFAKFKKEADALKSYILEQQ